MVGASQMATTLLGGTVMDEERRLAIPQLFARWAREEFPAWRQAIGASVTHLSRGDGRVTDVSQEAGSIAVHVRYARAERRHPLWEFRTELMRMTLPTGLSRDDLMSTVTARRLRRAQDKKADRAAVSATSR